jgi:hypothetical protein
MVELIQERWLGAARKKGLKAQVHMLAFVLDPYAQAAVTTPTDPTTLLLNSGTMNDAREALRQYICEADQRAMISQQLQLWQAARPALPPSGSGEGGSNEPMPSAATMGRNAFSSLYLAGMQLTWDKAQAREEKIGKEELTRPVADSDDLGFDLAETIARLKLAGKPTTFWLSMFSEQPEGAKREELEAHKFDHSQLRGFSRSSRLPCQVV